MNKLLVTIGGIFWLSVAGGILFIIIQAVITSPVAQTTEKAVEPSIQESPIQENSELGQMLKRYFETEPGWEDYAKTDTEILVAKYLAIKNLLKEHDDFETSKILLTAVNSDWTLKEIQHYIYCVKMIEEQ